MPQEAETDQLPASTKPVRIVVQVGWFWTPVCWIVSDLASSHAAVIAEAIDIDPIVVRRAIAYGVCGC